MRILIAEDAAVSRTILKAAVEKLGHECLVAEDGNRALEIYSSNTSIDVVISDWMMPEMDGLELCHRLRLTEQERYTYFIFLTALDEKKHMLTGLQAGADDYLAKPLDIDELQVRLIAAARITSLYRQLYERSRTDALTNLGNRLRMNEDLDTLYDRVARYGRSSSMVLYDIDFFKSYNDHYGHLDGDHMLRWVASTIADHCRSVDTAYRYGGEEFLVLLPEQTLDRAQAVAARLRSAIESLGARHAKSPFGVITVSAGVAEMSAPPKSTSDLLKEADTALYRAKTLGRNQVATHEVAEQSHT